MRPELRQFSSMLFDVDNTLLTEKKEIPAGLLECLSRIRSRGIDIGLCTGRGYQALKHTVLLPMMEVGVEGIHVVSGGAQIINSKGEILEGHPISADFVHQVIDHFRSETKMRVVIVTHEAMFLNESYVAIGKRSWQSRVMSLDQYSGEQTYLININNIDDSRYPDFFRSSPVNIRFMTPSGLPASVDITATGINKGVAVKRLTQLGMIDLSRTIGFGDSANDTEFLREVGYAVAMGNASAKLQSEANLVIGHVNDGALPNFLLELLEQ